MRLGKTIRQINKLYWFGLIILAGLVVLILLVSGFTKPYTCPDECPTTLAVLKQVEAGLGKSAGRVGVVFITIDPERDTPPVLQAYLEKFDPSFIGITGTTYELQPIWQSYGVYIEKTMDPIRTGYTLTHSTRIYLVDAQGNFRLTYSYGTSPDDIIYDVQHLLG